MDGQVPADGASSGGIVWPVRSGLVPPLARGFTSRPESAAAIARALRPGSVTVLVPARVQPAPDSPDWLAASGKTQLAAHLAESMWRAGQLDLLVWITATSRVPIVSGLAAAIAAIGTGQADDAESAAARFVG